jgi:hypothetical protein
VSSVNVLLPDYHIQPPLPQRNSKVINPTPRQHYFPTLPTPTTTSPDTIPANTEHRLYSFSVMYLCLCRSGQRKNANNFLSLSTQRQQIEIDLPEHIHTAICETTLHCSFHNPQSDFHCTAADSWCCLFLGLPSRCSGSRQWWQIRSLRLRYCKLYIFLSERGPTGC